MTLQLPAGGTFVGRAWRPDIGPAVVVRRGDHLVDITSSKVPTMQALLELDDPAGFANGAEGPVLGALQDVAKPSADGLRLMAPCDLQPVKACGVTFVSSMLERVIEEQAKGDPARAEAIRERCAAILGESLRAVQPGSEKAGQLKEVLIADGVWSQYLEVGIGPYAEVFSKAQPMSAVGFGAEVGLHPVSTWNNPEPEIVLACDSTGRVRGATLGNDVNLRDVEGRSALLLGKAKDNNASCAVGPMLRLFDDSYGIDDVRQAELTLTVTGEDGYVLNGRSSMSQISRDPLDLVSQTFGAHHQYPDGFFLMLGTLFAPTEDRDHPGEGFTHKLGDVVEISEPSLGLLRNTVRLSTECAPWVFGTSALMRNLAGRGLL
ncbi:fumarylacetoacetate hydrolase family protein [Mameliella sediminis]|uniref:fumarylacetoacetate hydrolase family protein n=1 Tax=Mameliella sediminis TaxID=2836866 RepID=UPI001C4871D9|nr:fumarylacetoacetate hydrolase family protein [Mameliella sediminis]MBV7393049.1 fumarylacetoacetate hydrolase family protein [Mameliella sediminis]